MNALNITRENYEEYFILYLDDELSREERLSVEQFAAQHADLAKELSLLLNMKLKPDEHSVFTGKDELLRTEGITINETNFEEYFLLYVDDELSKAKREETELFVLQHPHLQPAFTAIKKTVLPQEDVVFENKSELLQYEKRKRFFLRPLYIAAAAVFAGISFTGWWFIQHSSKEGASKTAIAKKPAELKYFAKPQHGLLKYNSDTVLVNKAIAQKPVNKTSAKDDMVMVTAAEKIKQKQLPVAIVSNKPKDGIPKKDETAIQNPRPEHNALQEDPHPFLIDKSDKPDMQNNTAKNDDIENINEGIAGNESENNSIYKSYPVAYKEINTKQDEQEKSLYVGSFNLNKGKVKGLLKKAGKLFGNKARNNANDRQQMQISNMETDSNNQ